MMDRIEQLVGTLGLLPHPEGGFYKETYRSERTLEGTEKHVATSIYFLLTSDNPSRFHRIQSDELWFFHEGSPLTVHILDEGKHTELKLGLSIQTGETPYHLVKGGTIFGSTVDQANSYALVSCVVAPGFDFSEFELFSADELLKDYPDHTTIIARLT